MRGSWGLSTGCLRGLCQHHFIALLSSYLHGNLNGTNGGGRNLNPVKRLVGVQGLSWHMIFRAQSKCSDFWSGFCYSLALEALGKHSITNKTKEIKWTLYGYYIGRQCCVLEVCLNMPKDVNHIHGASWPPLFILKYKTKFDGWPCFSENINILSELRRSFQNEKIEFSSKAVLCIFFQLIFSTLRQKYFWMTRKRGRNPCQA